MRSYIASVFLIPLTCLLSACGYTRSYEEYSEQYETPNYEQADQEKLPDNKNSQEIFVASSIQPADYHRIKEICLIGSVPNLCRYNLLSTSDLIQVREAERHYADLMAPYHARDEYRPRRQDHVRPHRDNSDSSSSQSDTGLSDAAIRRLLIRESIASYPGNCPCPYNSARNGSSCGGRSAYSRAGGYSPLCYSRDVTKGMIVDWRRNHPAK